MKRGFFRYLVTFLAPVILSLPWLGQVGATESLTITHSVQSYSSDGPTMTVILNLEVQNNGITGINDITISQASLPKFPLSPIEEAEEPQTTSIGNLAAGQTTNMTYTLTSHIIYPEEEIATLPMFWEVSYLDGANQQTVDIIESQDSAQGGGQ